MLVPTSYPSVLGVFLSVIFYDIMTRSKSRSPKYEYISYLASTHALQLLVKQYTCPSDFTFSLITRPKLLYICLIFIVLWHSKFI